MPFFEDPEFPPQVAMKNTPVKFEWVPASCLLGGKTSKDRMPLFWRIEPTDMKQGAVGDCWLVAALACLASFPREVEALFETTTAAAAPDGMYVIRLYDMLGRVCRVTVDEYVPTMPVGPHSRVVGYEYLKHVPIFAKPNGEIWPLLLEKAMAKLFGSYAAMNGGHTCTAFRALTGCTKQEMWKRVPQENHWTSNLLQEGSLAMFFTRHWKRLHSDQFASLLLHCDRIHYMMSAGISSPRGSYLNVGEFVRQDGLIENHAYSIIETKEFQGFIMLRLRNPWGRGRWNGDWSDGSPMWQRFPGVAKALNFRPVGVVDSHLASGGFWMAFQDFARIFDEISICRKSMNAGLGRTQLEMLLHQEIHEQDKVEHPTTKDKNHHGHLDEARLQHSESPRKQNVTPTRRQNSRRRSITPTRRCRSPKPNAQEFVGKCQQEHVLKAFWTPQPGFTCDRCHMVMIEGVRMHGCRECDYDVCMACSQKESKQIPARVGW